MINNRLDKNVKYYKLFSVLGLDIQAAPTKVDIGVTRYLTIKCLAPKESSSSMESLISLVISRSDGPQNAIFKELASINVFHVDGQVIQNTNEIETSEGKIDNDGLSYLTLVWEFPDTNKAGVYMCLANGVDFSGHPFVINTTVTVQSAYPGVDTIVNQVRNLTLQVEQMNILLNGVENFREMWVGRLQRMKSVIFSYNTFHNGHRYYLSHAHGVVIVHEAAAVCEMFGGYLVEIDSAEEYAFLKSFLNNHTNFRWVFTGVNDEQTDNQWINTHAGSVASSYFQFYTGEPNGGRTENCLGFFQGYPVQMTDLPCTYKRDIFDLGFMCEIVE
ncbi:uncharacterized protein LOC131958031 [Physella acuta]|uniref:uncharacterized protein LOC131958031 n=1 Tax=Physella acuta TaxID=109671 RepID=UPI0027DD88B6|nr:uncharacterized protein LOC131958031 [Physella acuta]